MPPTMLNSPARTRSAATRTEKSPLRVQPVADTPAATVSLAAALLESGHMRLAEREVRIALHQNPESADGHLVLALVEMQDARSVDAVERLETAVRLDPSNATAWMLLAYAHRNGEDLTEALSAADEALRCCDETADRVAILIFRGELLSALNRTDEAHSCFQQVLELDPESDGAHRGAATLSATRGEWDEAIRYGARAVRLQAADGSTRRTLGDAFHESDELGPALWEYTLSLVSSSEGYRRMAVTLMQQEFPEGALGLLRFAMMFHPGDIPLYLETARVYLVLKRRAEAEALCRAALRLQPGHSEAQTLLKELEVES